MTSVRGPSPAISFPKSFLFLLLLHHARLEVVLLLALVRVSLAQSTAPAYTMLSRRDLAYASKFLASLKTVHVLCRCESCPIKSTSSQAEYTSQTPQYAISIVTLLPVLTWLQLTGWPPHWSEGLNSLLVMPGISQSNHLLFIRPHG